ncbi:alpha/beta hydrolase family esterase [Rhodospirillum centenum]|uniref:Polyhydroxyalkanoic acid depolymerase n=1 Tax=Rhodospirillum centenum (strain ATCC 51521 / SW) TaxID=414684 RepID=B6IQJ8_RHOCS|nr:PHB depolymerase family esterase [Rhodospirillum centenum]ACI97734.1 polyhydroxyalkanoic acid depolymerase [Rhodospirillum centenum SW]
MKLDDLMPGMSEATRLTRSGRLAEATALIQRLLGRQSGNRTPSPPPADARVLDPPTLDLAAESVRVAEPERPPPEPGDGRMTAHRFANAAGARDYRLFVPAGTPERPRPLIVMLHGCTQTPEDFAAGTRMNLLAQQHGCIVVWPAQTSGANPSGCWNWFRPEDQGRDRGEPAIIAGITREIMRAHDADPARVYVAGLSAGGAKAAILALAYPELFAAVGVHSGLACGAARDLPGAFTAMRQGAAPGRPVHHGSHGRPVPAIVFHGDRDSTVNPRNGEAVVTQFSGTVVTGTPRVERGRAQGGRSFTRALHAGRDGRVLVEHWTIHGAGHAWAGGSAEGSYTDPRGPDASREMLRFFLEHPHPAAGRAAGGQS